MQLVFYTAAHYPAPTPNDDSGDLSNVTQANWKTIVKDLKDNRNGVPSFWSAYMREELHENYHWEKEWQVEAKKGIIAAEAEIAKLSLGFDKAATAGDADTQLKPQATTLFDKAIKDARKDWFANYGDNPGDPPYIAQAPGIDALKTRVENHAAAKKWDTP
jgi:hypothetical protein